ncbi:MAG: sterol desaturase family protein [Pseudomonadota bacterium]
MTTIAGLSEPALRFGAFAGIFITMALLELWLPRRKLAHKRLTRWFTNLSMVGLGIATVRVIGAVAQLVAMPLIAVAAALFAEQQGWGLFNLVGLPFWLEVVLAICILDFAIWLQHVASHKIPIFWRLHQMHHADVDFDVTTALRFHPIEIGISMLWKVVCVLILGPAALAVVLFEVILNGSAMFNHANVKLPRWLDAIARKVIVTPDMHRVHHSTDRVEHDMNYGFALSIWDRMFGTYQAQPAAGHEAMAIGLEPYQTPAPTKLGWSLALPFWKLK